MSSCWVVNNVVAVARTLVMSVTGVVVLAGLPSTFAKFRKL